jgi:hypothetical protein
MPAILRPYLARLLAAWIAAASGWVASTVGVEISPDEQMAIFNAALGVGLTVYAVAHRLIDSRLNPADAASPTVAEAHADVAEAERAAKP